MLEYQYFRSILLITDLLSFIVGYTVAASAWRSGRPVYHAMSSLLLISWVQTISVLLYTRVRLRKAEKEGYFQVPLGGNQDFVVSDMPGLGKLGPGMDILTFLLDLVLGLAMLITFPWAFTKSGVQLSGVACMGAIVSMLVHLSYLLLSLAQGTQDTGFWKYKIKLVVVRRDEATAAAVGTGVKEQSSAEVSLQDPGSPAPRPYRGSPSTQPTHGPTSPREGPIRLTEPTETDALIADHD